MGLTCLWFAQFLEPVCLSLAKFRMSSVIISLCTFSSLPTFSSPGTLNYMNVKFFVIPSQVPHTRFIFFSLFSLCCTGWVFFIVLALSLLILSSILSILLLSPSTEVLFWLLHFSVLKFQIGCFLYLLFPCWGFLFPCWDLLFFIYLFQEWVLLLVETFLSWVF